MTSYTPNMLRTIIFFGRDNRGPGPLQLYSVKIIVATYWVWRRSFLPGLRSANKALRLSVNRYERKRISIQKAPREHHPKPVYAR